MFDWCYYKYLMGTIYALCKSIHFDDFDIFFLTYCPFIVNCYVIWEREHFGCLKNQNVLFGLILILVALWEVSFVWIVKSR